MTTEPINQMQILLEDEQKMQAFGEKIAQVIGQINAPLLILLNGDLGAGKTTLSRGILYGLGHRGSVKSPTYTLVEPYDLEIGKVFHFDLYRLVDPEELYDIGFNDYLTESQLCMIEWPDKGGSLLPKADISLQINSNGTGRQVILTAQTSLGSQCVNELR
ncbi:tRNA (adenosine(37)-N6)-threonylcarbamoyltransferase complex ATPase subunit type 1 TsaE [Porticoccaceae bacterium]|nr:tRNA (adenosine(37)-N6)-threonylcarbamoyltransferase complex ATPase subunit type 1 TsaE [Porticoccaceae bacterium]